ncbi:hypothetical protein [Caulobacter segnis]
MPASSTAAAKEAEKAKSATLEAVEHAERSFAQAADAARVQLTEAAKRVEKSVSEGFETLRAQSRTYTDTAGQQLEDAQRYASERIRERPITATLAGLGVGVLIGLLLSGGRSNNR